MTESLDALYQGRSYDLEWKGKADDLPFWHAVVARYRPANVLELAVGTGRIAIPLARAGIEQGFSITGLDMTAPMLESAQASLGAEPEAVRRNLTLVHGDMRDFSLDDGFDLVFVGFNSIIHLMTLDDQLGAFRSVRRHLTEGGRFIVD